MPSIKKGFTITLDESVKRVQPLGIGTLYAIPGQSVRMTADQHAQWSKTVAFKKLTAKRHRGQPAIVTVTADGESKTAEASAEE